MNGRTQATGWFRMNTKDIKKIVLAYSGGLDTSVILRWLQDHYSAEVVTFTADIGQGEDIEPARAKAELLGIKEIFIEDLATNLFYCLSQNKNNNKQT